MGARRFRSTSTASALSGEMYSVRHRAFFSGTSWNIEVSIAVRKAARVFPEPVGARSSVLLPARMGGHPSTWARVGASNEAANQSRTGCWKELGTEVCNVSAPLESNPKRRPKVNDASYRRELESATERRVVHPRKR